MKVSMYNFFYPLEEDDSKVIAFNARTCALALIDQEKYGKYKNFAENGTEIDDDDFRNDLKKALFILDDDENELDVLRYSMYRSRFDTRTLTLTLVPTSDCNFKCVYCYEKATIKPIYMTEEIQDSVIELIHNQARFIDLLTITWYGGEPLMAMDIIKSMTKRIIDICEEFKIFYQSNIVTNGYLLNKDDVSEFEALKITNMQVTLDGTAEIHDRRRPLADGSETFDTIMKNIKECYEFLPNVSLRVNTDKENVDSFQKILTYIVDNNMQTKVIPYMGKVCNDNECYVRSKCFTCSEFSKIDFDSIKLLMDVYSPEVVLDRYPTTRTTFCGADINNAFIINADGGMYKCWSDLGSNNRCIGNITYTSNKPSPVYLDYLLHDATITKSCSECKFIPVCMGGCPFQRVVGNKDHCITQKYIMDELIQLVAKTQIKKRMEVTEDRSKTSA